MIPITDQLYEAASNLLNDIEAMQSKEKPSWFEGFTAWEYDGTEEGEDDSMAFEWPNLAISVQHLKRIMKEFKDFREAVLNAESAAIQAKMIHGETR